MNRKTQEAMETPINKEDLYFPLLTINIVPFNYAYDIFLLKNRNISFFIK
jgi:hypothetical protein